MTGTPISGKSFRIAGRPEAVFPNGSDPELLGDVDAPRGRACGLQSGARIVAHAS